MSRFRMHYKNKPYRLLGRVHHSETQEALTLYECLYPNETGPLWVRPEAMFHESVQLPSGTVARFREIPLAIERATKLGDEQWAKIEPLWKGIFGEADRSKAEAKHRETGDPLILIGSFEGDVVGFKLGHRVDAETYGSWMGGVREDRRGLGVGSELMKAQHDWARERGYKRILTKTRNKWPEMLILNLRSGFRVLSAGPGPQGDVEILLEKRLDVGPEKT